MNEELEEILMCYQEVYATKLNGARRRFDKAVSDVVRLERVESAARDVVNAGKGRDPNSREYAIMVGASIKKLEKALENK